MLLSAFKKGCAKCEGLKHVTHTISIGTSFFFWFIYRLLFETSATASCGTTGICIYTYMCVYIYISNEMYCETDLLGRDAWGNDKVSCIFCVTPWPATHWHICRACPAPIGFSCSPRSFVESCHASLSVKWWPAEHYRSPNDWQRRSTSYTSTQQAFVGFKWKRMTQRQKAF